MIAKESLAIRPCFAITFKEIFESSSLTNKHPLKTEIDTEHYISMRLQ